jgi:hypothetical protein
VSCLDISNYSSPSYFKHNGLMVTGGFDFGIHMWKSYVPGDISSYSFDFHEDYITSLEWNS